MRFKIDLAIFRLLSSPCATQTVGDTGRLSREVRLGLVVLGLGAMSLLIVATQLTPSPDGFGTHRQLGLPPCTFILLWNTPCPSCGMTTAFAHFVRGQWGAAFRSNAGGLMLAVLVLAIGPWALASAALGRFVICPPRERVLVIAAFMLVAITLIDWITRLVAS